MFERFPTKKSAQWQRLHMCFTTENLHQLRQAKEHRYQPKIVMRVDDLTSMHRAVKQGIGVARMPCFIAQGLSDKSVIQLAIKHPLSNWGVWLLSHIDLKSSARINWLKEFLSGELTKLPPIFEWQTQFTAGETMRQLTLLFIFLSICLNSHANKVDGKKEILINNDKVQVVRLTYPPGSESGMHSHDYPHRVVYVLSGGKLQFEHTDQSTKTIQAEKDSALFVPAQTHNVKNIGKTTVILLETEIK